MPSSTSTGNERQSQTLSTILKAIRKERRLSAATVAEAMGLSPKTYENFEAGRGRLDLARIRQFADATESDAVAIMLGAMFESVDIALRAMDNKISTILWIALSEFSEDTGEAVASIPGAVAFEAFRQAFRDLSGYLRRRDESAERWLEREIRRLYRGESG